MSERKKRLDLSEGRDSVDESNQVWLGWLYTGHERCWFLLVGVRAALDQPIHHATLHAALL
jgi:hypothetical protein